MSDFEDFEELFAKEAETNLKQHNNINQENEDDFEENIDQDNNNNEDEDDDEEEEEEYYYKDNNHKSNITESVELDEYLTRKIHHLCISLSSFINSKFDITSTTLSNLKQLKQGLQFDSKKLESHTVFIQLYKNNILIHDLIPILALFNNSPNPSDYLNKCVIRTLEIIYKLTQKIELNEESSSKEIEEYNEVKKIQLIYKKQLLNTKLLTSFVKLLMTNCLLGEKGEKKENSSKITIFVINIIKNMLEIEPFEIILSGDKWKKLQYKQINQSSCLPKGVSNDDINIKQVVNKFNESAIFPVLIKITQQLGQRKNLFSDPDDEERIYLPIMDIWYYMIKDISPDLYKEKETIITVTKKVNKKNDISQSPSGSKLATLLAKDTELKKRIVNNTSSRHSKFGSLITIETGDNRRTQVSSINNSTLTDKGMDFLDLNKKTLPRMKTPKTDDAEGWLKSSHLMALFENDSLVSLNLFNQWIEKFILSKAFANLISLITGKLKEDGDLLDDNDEICCKYIVFLSWFIQYHFVRSSTNSKFAKLLPKLINMNNIGLIKLLFDMYTKFATDKEVNHCFVHAFNKLYTLILTIITADSKSIVTYYLVIMYILKRIDLHNAMCSYTRILNNSTNICLQESSVILISYLIKFSQQIGQFQLNIESIEKDPLLKHNVYKLVKLLEFDTLKNTVDFINVNFSDQEPKLNYSFIFHHNTISTLICLLEVHSHLSYSSQKTLLKLLNLCQRNQPTALQRIDLLLQLRQLSKDTPQRARLYKHVNAFSKLYLTTLKTRFVKNPQSAPIELLFIKKNHNVNDLYGDKEFLRSGELSKEFVDSYLSVRISELKEEVLERLDSLTPVEALKSKFGMIIGALMEKEKLKLIVSVLSHLKQVKTKIVEEKQDEIDFVLKDVVTEEEKEKTDGTTSTVTVVIPIDKASKRDSDFRLFLKMLGYNIPKNVDQKCELPSDIDLAKLNFNITIIVTFMETPLELNGEDDVSMHSLFDRFDEKKRKKSQKKNKNSTASGEDDDVRDDNFRSERYDDSDGFIISDDDDEGYESNNDKQDVYFRQLIEKNVKRKPTSSKNQKKSSKKQSKDEKSIKSSKQKKKKSTIVSKALLSSSSEGDDSEDEESDVIFFENELYSKLARLIHNGQLTPELETKMNDFRDLRAKKETIDETIFKELFKGDVPQPKELNSLISKFRKPTGNAQEMNNKSDSDAEEENNEIEVDENASALQLTQIGTSEEDKVRIGRINKLREAMGKLTGAKTQKKGLLNEDDSEEEEEEDEEEKADDVMDNNNSDEDIQNNQSNNKSLFDDDSGIEGENQSDKQNSEEEDDESDEESLQPSRKKRRITITEDDEK